MWTCGGWTILPIWQGVEAGPILPAWQCGPFMAECGGWTISQYGRVLEIGPSFQYGRMLKLLIWQDMEEGPSSQYGRVWRLNYTPNMAGCGGWTIFPIWQSGEAVEVGGLCACLIGIRFSRDACQVERLIQPPRHTK